MSEGHHKPRLGMWHQLALSYHISSLQPFKAQFFSPGWANIVFRATCDENTLDSRHHGFTYPCGSQGSKLLCCQTLSTSKPDSEISKHVARIWIRQSEVEPRYLWSFSAFQRSALSPGRSLLLPTQSQRVLLLNYTRIPGTGLLQWRTEGLKVHESNTSVFK